MTIDVPAATVHAAQHGDERAMEDALAAVWPHAYRIAYGITRERWLAQDAAQDACAQMYRRMQALRDPAAFGAWCYRIVVRCARDIAKREARNRDRTNPKSSPDGTVSEDRASIAVALKQLPLSLREVVVLRYYAELNSREIARVLNLPDGTVRFRLHSAKKKLHALLSDDRSEALRKVNAHAH